MHLSISAVMMYSKRLFLSGSPAFHVAVWVSLRKNIVNIYPVML